MEGSTVQILEVGILEVGEILGQVQTSAFGDNLVIPQKIKNSTMMWSNNPISGYITKRNERKF